MIRSLVTAGLLILAQAAAAQASAAQTGATQAGAGVCAGIGTDDSLRPLPPALVGAARHAFGYTGLSAAQIERQTVFRCLNSHALICSWGANLPCGKANTAPSLPAATQWCAANPNADFIPAYVTGHDTIYQWSCKSGAAVANQPAPLDARGFFQSYWVAVP